MVLIQRMSAQSIRFVGGGSVFAAAMAITLGLV